MKSPRLVLQIVSVLALVLVATHAVADAIDDDLENLGNNQQVKDRAAHLDSRTRIGIVQGREVDRNWRLETGVSYGPVAFGDAYLNTQNLGANLDLHINPHLSVGIHYAKAFSQLTSEGQDRFNVAQSTGGSSPLVSYPEQSVMGVVNWYMMYGKINFFDIKTVQFDIYSLAGFGQEDTNTTIGSVSNDTWGNTWTAGGGIGFWFSQHLTSRIEVRYQTYADEDGTRNLNLVVGNIGFGVLL